MMLKSLALLGLVAVGGASPIAGENTGETTLPITEAHTNLARDDGTINERAFFDMINRVIGKYRKDAFIDIDWSKYGLEKRGSKVPLTDFVQQKVDELYYGTGRVGATKPQTFTLNFDTGSSDAFIPGPGCGSCNGKTRYDRGGTNRGNKTSVTYGSGQVSGENYLDTLCVGGLCAKNQNIIALKKAQGFSGQPAAGLVGMAWESIAASKSPPFFTTLIKEGRVRVPEFSFFLGRKASGTAQQSEMVLGGRDAGKYTGAFTNIPLSAKTYWQIAVDAVKVAGQKVTGSTGNAAIDTGTTIILMPSAVATATCGDIPGCAPAPGLSGSPDLTLFEIPCDTKTTPHFTFGGKDFAVNPLDLTIGTVTGLFRQIVNDHAVEKRQLPGFPLPIGGGGGGLGGLCVASFGGFDIDPALNLYVVGDTFLKNFYSVFNMGAKPYVGFAKARGNYGA